MRVLQVLGNLISNALKFTGPGGQVIVGVRRDADLMELWVRDTGVGIPAEDLPRLFDPVWLARRAHYRGAGSGLGLAIARGIVLAHGGTIGATSLPGQGSTFRFTIPANGR
jgi:signal transduction histidine kinase